MKHTPLLIAGAIIVIVIVVVLLLLRGLQKEDIIATFTGDGEATVVGEFTAPTSDQDISPQVQAAIDAAHDAAHDDAESQTLEFQETCAIGDGVFSIDEEHKRTKSQLTASGQWLLSLEITAHCVTQK